MTEYLFDATKYERPVHPWDEDVAGIDEAWGLPESKNDSGRSIEGLPESKNDSGRRVGSGVGVVEPYESRGTGRGGNKYFRYAVWRHGRLRHYHIRGGNINSEAAQAHAEIVRQAIAAGRSVEEIKKIISGFGKCDRARPPF